MKQMLIILLAILLIPAACLSYEAEEDGYSYQEDTQGYSSYEAEDSYSSYHEQEFLPEGDYYDNSISYEVTDDGRLRDMETLETYTEDQFLPSGSQWEENGDDPAYGIRVY